MNDTIAREFNRAIPTPESHSESALTENVDERNVFREAKWVMERQCVKTDKASGIVNDANDYANETMNNPAYPLELFQRVITVSLETMKIVRGLPELDID